MKTFKEFIFTVNFRHVFVLLLLLSFIMLTALPFWIGSKYLSTQSWTYLTTSQGAIIVLLTLAGRRYFESKTQNNDIINNNPTPFISNEQSSCGYNNTQNRNINIQQVP